MAAPWRGWCMNSEAIVILSSRRQKPTWPKPGDYRSDVYRVGPWERAGHPNGKPVARGDQIGLIIDRDVAL